MRENALQVRNSESKNASENCTSKLIIRITKYFLYHLGNDTIPDGYWNGVKYEQKYQDDDFSEFYNIFTILIVMTILCILAFVLMILMCIWLRNNRDIPRVYCRCSNKLMKLIPILLLLLLIFMILPLYIIIKSSLDFKRSQSSDNTNDTSQSNSENLQKISSQLEKLLITDYDDMKTKALQKFNESGDPKEYELPETIKAEEMARNNTEAFDDYIVEHIESDFNRAWFWADAYRMFSRNLSAYVGLTEKGQHLVNNDEIARYYDYIYTLNDFADLWNAAHSISKLMHYYKNLNVTSLSAKKDKPEMYKRLKDLLDDTGRNATLLKTEIENLLGNPNEESEKNHQTKSAVDFALIASYITIPVLLIYLIILLRGMCKKRDCTRTMVKPLTCIYVTLVLLFVLMAFAFFFPFFYGVVDYNAVCNQEQKQNKPKGTSFYTLLQTECTGDKKIYTIITDNDLVEHPISKWEHLHASNLKTECNEDCPPISMTFLKENMDNTTDYKLQKCLEDRTNPGERAKPWQKKIATDITQYQYPTGYEGEVLIDQSPPTSYFWQRLKGAECNLNYGSQLQAFQDKGEYRGLYSKPIGAKASECFKGYEETVQNVRIVNSSIKELESICSQLYADCSNYADEAAKANNQLNEYKEDAERQLKDEIGPCEALLDMLKGNTGNYCDCDMYLLNGVWVGSLLLLLPLFLSLMLLSCLICISKRCANCDCVTRRASQRSRRYERRPRRQLDCTNSIVLPPVILPRSTLCMMQAHPKPEVRYLVK